MSEIVYNNIMIQTQTKEFYQINCKGVDIMKITITGRNIELTQGIKDAVEEKLGKLEKYFKPETDVLVTLGVEKDRHKIEVTIPTKGQNTMFDGKNLIPETIK